MVAQHPEENGRAMLPYRFDGYRCLSSRGADIHSWSGVGVLADIITSADIRQIARSEKVSDRIIEADVLIIEEVSDD